MSNILILGGSGFIGRNLVQWLIEEHADECARIRVCDKTPPALAFMDPKQVELFCHHPKVQFIQYDLTKDAHVEKAFTVTDQEDRHSWEFVVNLCGETRFGMTAQDYQNRIVVTAEKCARMAVGKVKKWIEISSAAVYKPEATPSNESSPISPWTTTAKYRYMVEQMLGQIEGLPIVILRPSLVYGCGDLTSLTPRLSTAATYTVSKEKMKLLWSKDLALSCVHVMDLCNAIWHAVKYLDTKTIVNISDSTGLNQGKLNAILEEIFGIETGFVGKIMSNLAKLNFSSVVESANEKHVPAWQKLCMDHGIRTTPISPYLDTTLLGNNSLNIDGTAITNSSPFRYQYPQLTKELLLEQLRYFINLNLFPNIVECDTL